jgi:DNA-binding IclR family transcriptional regulator
MAGGSNQQGRTVISKVSAILVAISEGSRTLTEIAARTGLPLSTVHRLATELAAWRVLERTTDGSYRAGPPLRTIGSTGDAASACVDDDVAVSVRDRAVPIIEDLFRAVGVRVRVGFLDEALLVAYVQKDSPHQPVSRECPAARLPAHATALGKALLAFSPPAVTKTVLGRRLRRYTPFTVTRPEVLVATFKTIRATRLAVCDRELEWDSCAVAAPVFGAGGQVVAAIELQTHDLARDIEGWLALLSVAAGSLSRDLGHQPVDRSAVARQHLRNVPAVPDQLMVGSS